VSTRVLVIGSGAREHALAWGFWRSGAVDEVVAAPGNPGIAQLAECLPVNGDDPAAIVAIAKQVDADLVVVGPEAPLVAGAVDALHADGRVAFGPTAAAARLEGSKAWMKELLAEGEVPTARYATFGAGEEAAAVAFLESLPGGYVLKTDGLAAGKGVLVTESLTEARATLHEYLSGAAFGAAGTTCVIEEEMRGPELSLLVLCDGARAWPLQAAQDHKRVGDGDTGPNTGGMGAYSPVPFVDHDLVDEVMERCVRPTLAALGRRGITYRGILYTGLMLTDDGPKVVEYNVRFGDPECEALLPLLSSDLYAHCVESATGTLETPVRFLDDACVCVMLAADGYPTTTRTGDPIEGLEAAAAVDGVTIFHAGTKLVDDELHTAGGRVLAISAVGADVDAARERAYTAAARIAFPGVHYRHDIALQGLP
jgi:phosphoribosylamine--glycine ligase